MVAGVPFAGVLTAVMSHVLPRAGGPTLVLIPATIWPLLDRRQRVGNAPGDLDPGSWERSTNFLRPVLIKQGADLPLLLIFAGVTGGLRSLGLWESSWAGWCSP